MKKDLSRLGRDYIGVGYYIEVYFPNKDVRYIAINDNVDSKEEDGLINEMTPIINLLNEQYAKDNSIKIRSVMEARALQGEHLTGTAPYGYKKSRDNNKKLIVDENVAPIIKLIFDQSSKGNGAGKIRNMLKAKEVPTPSAYKFITYGTRCRNRDDIENNKYNWTNKMVLDILKNEVYLGTKVYYKSRKATHKSKCSVQEKDKVIRIENVHEPIIDKKLFERVQNRMKKHTYYKGAGGEVENIFKGIAKCGCCGSNMQVNEVLLKDRRGEILGKKKYLMCRRKALEGEGACEGVSIAYDDLVEVVKGELVGFWSY